MRAYGRIALIWLVALGFAALLSFPVTRLVEHDGVWRVLGYALAVLFGTSMLRAAWSLTRDLAAGDADQERRRHSSQTNG